MNTRIIWQVMIAVIAIPILFWATQAILLNRTGGIAGVIKFIGITLAIVSFLRPKIGIIVVVIMTSFIDYFKKVGTYYGEATQRTVIEILAASMLVVGALLAGVLFKMIIERRGVRKVELAVIIVSSALMVLSFFREGSYLSGFQQAVNGGGFLLLGVAMAMIYVDTEDGLRILRSSFLIMLAWPIYGIYQYYVGFSDMEIWYSNTNFSTTNTPLDLLVDKEAIGFGTYKGGYAIVGMMYLFALWHAIVFKKRRVFYILMFLLCAFAMSLGSSRSALAFPILVLGIYGLLSSRILTLGGAVLGGCAIVALILFSTEIRYGIDDVNHFVSSNLGGFGDKFNLNTYAERLISLEQMKDPNAWTLTGFVESSEELTNRDFGYSHTLLTDILFQFGALAFIGFILLILAIGWYAARLVFSVEDKDTNKHVRYCMGVFIVSTLLVIMGTSSLHTNPSNVWRGLHVGVMLLAVARARNLGSAGGYEHKTKSLNESNKESE